MPTIIAPTTHTSHHQRVRSRGGFAGAALTIAIVTASVGVSGGVFLFLSSFNGLGVPNPL
jgi:hypothetical protein